MWHGYIAVENMALNDNQRDTLRTALRALGPASDPSPARLNHWRVRLDGQAAIYEANFQDSALTVQSFKDRLAAIFSVDPATVNHTTQQVSYGPVVTFERGGTDYIRFAAFGGVGATWEQSRQATLSYLAANSAEWEAAVP